MYRRILIALIVSVPAMVSACGDAQGVGVWAMNDSDEPLVLLIAEKGGSEPEAYRLDPRLGLRRSPWIVLGATGGTVLIEVLREGDCTSLVQAELPQGEYRLSVAADLEAEVSGFAFPGKGPSDVPTLTPTDSCPSFKTP